MKTHKKKVFYALATLEKLTGLEMRGLGHQRQQIENNGFKEFNAQVNSKHVYTHHQEVFVPLYLILMITFNLVQLHWYYGLVELQLLCPGAKLTLQLLIGEPFLSVFIDSN